MSSFLHETLSKTIAALVASLILGLLAILAASFGLDIANPLTRKIAALGLSIILAGVVVFVFTARRQTEVQPKVSQSRFSRLLKAASILALALSIVPVWLTFQPETQYNISVRMKLENGDQSEVIINNRAEIWIWSSSILSEGGPRATGVLKLYGQNGVLQETYEIPANGSIYLIGEVQAPMAFKPYLESASWDFSITLAKTSGRHVFMNGTFPFDKETIQQYYIPIDVNK